MILQNGSCQTWSCQISLIVVNVVDFIIYGCGRLGLIVFASYVKYIKEDKVENGKDRG